MASQAARWQQAVGPCRAGRAGLTGCFSPGGAQTLTWSVVPGPNATGSSVNVLGGVACGPAAACTATSYYSAVTGNTPRTLIESGTASG
jgi:hypothetical protein